MLEKRSLSSSDVVRDQHVQVCVLCRVTSRSLARSVLTRPPHRHSTRPMRPTVSLGRVCIPDEAVLEGPSHRRRLRAPLRRNMRLVVVACGTNS